MKSLEISEIIRLKDLNERQKKFVYALVKQGGKFSNKDLAKLWGTKSFSANFKKILLEDPPILTLIQNRPQLFALATAKEKITQITTIKAKKDRKFESKDILSQIEQKFSNLEKNYLHFKDNIRKDIQNLMLEIGSLKRSIKHIVKPEKGEEYKLKLLELEKEVFIIYNQLKSRSHQPIKIESIWEHLLTKYPYYKWETFSNQILKINSNHFHLEEGIAGKYIYDPYNNKKYGYVIGN